MREIIGMKNAGFIIIEAKYATNDTGYCIGRTDHQYVTWWFRRLSSTEITFYHGNYFPIDMEEPNKSAAKANADYHSRLANAFNDIAKYGY